MKKIFLLAMFMVVVQGCTRASRLESTKIAITLPTSAIMMQSIAGTNGGVSAPTNLGDINCYGVFAGGPEPEMSVNKCTIGSQGSNGQKTIVGEFKFNKDWVAGVPAGKTIEMELPSGKERVITLIGMKVANLSDCKDFRSGTPGNAQSSEPYVLGKADYLELKPGETMPVSVTMTLDPSKSLVGCEGPTAPPSNPDGGDGGGNGDGNNGGPYLRLHGLGGFNAALNQDLATLGLCYEVKAHLFAGQGNQWYNTEAAPVLVNVGSVSFGQFYANADCTSSASQFQIPPAATESASLYFKAHTSVNDISLQAAGVSTSGVTTSYSLAGQKFKTGYRRIVVSGPPKAVINQCYQYKLTSTRFEGGELEASSSGEFGNLTTSVDFTLRQDPGCTGGIVPMFSPYQKETYVYGKMTNAVPLDLGTKISFVGYTVDSFPIQRSTAENHFDRLEMSFPDNKLIRGQCVRGSLRVVNHDGGVVNANISINARVKVAQGAGVFYLSPTCNGGEIDQISIPLNSSEASFWFRTHAAPASLLDNGNLWITIDAGALTQGTAGSKSFPVDNGMFNDWAAPQPPSFSGAEIVGDHEFNDGALTKNIPIVGNYQGLVDVKCASAEYGSYTTCPVGDLDKGSIPYKFKWSATDAINNVHRWVKYEYGNYSRVFRISADALYGPKFKVIHCDSVAGTASGQSVANIDALAGPVVCLPQGVVFSKTNSNGYSISPAKTALIGHSSGESYLDGNANGGNMINVNAGTMTGFYYIANLRLTGVQSSTAMVNINSGVVASTAVGIIVNNVGGNTSSSAVTGLAVNYVNDVDVNILYRNSSLYMTGAGSKGVSSISSSNVVLEDLDIQLTGSVSGGYGIIFDNQTGTAADNLTVRRVKSTVASTSIALKVYNYNVSDSNLVIVADSVLKRTNNGDPTYPVVYMLGKMNAAIVTGNLFIAENVPNSALLSLNKGTYSPYFNLVGNTFAQSQPNKPALYQETAINYNDFSKNSFAYTGSSPFSTSGAIDIGVNYLYGATLLPDAAGENIFCSIGVNNFPVKVNGANVSGVNFSTAAVATNNVAGGSYRCMGPVVP